MQRNAYPAVTQADEKPKKPPAKPLTADDLARIERVVPQEMRDAVRWTLAGREGVRTWLGCTPEKDKAPIDPFTGYLHAWGEPKNWRTFSVVLDVAGLHSQQFCGLGLFLKKGPWVVLDLDNVLDEHGVLAQRAAEFLDALSPSFIETSASGSGLHVVHRGRLPIPQGAKVFPPVIPNAFGEGTQLEAWDGFNVGGKGHWVALTFRVHGGFETINDLTDADAALLLGLVPKQQPQELPPRPAIKKALDAQARKQQPADLAQRRVKKVIEQQLDAIAQAPEGTRNTTLNKEALRAFRLADGEGLDRETLAAQLEAAGQGAGLSAAEVAATVRSAAAGAEKYGPAYLGERPQQNTSQQRPADEQEEQQKPADEPHEQEEQQHDEHGPEWRPLSFDELLAQPPVEWLVEGLLPRVGVALLASEPQAGKSFVALDMALRLLCGSSSFLGKEVRGHGPVAYVALEGGPGMAARARAWRVAHRHEQLVHPLEFVKWTSSAAPLTNGQDAFADELRRCKRRNGGLALVVVDTLTLALCADENDSAQVGGSLRFLAALSEELRCCVMLVHHVRKADGKLGKPSRMVINDVRGSSAFIGNVDCVIGLDYREGRAERAVLSLKAKDGEKPPPIWFQLEEHATGLMREDGKPERSCVIVSVQSPNEVSPEEGKEAAENLLAGERRKKILEAAGRLRFMVSREDLAKAARGRTADNRTTITELVNEGALAMGRRHGRDVFGLPTTPVDDPGMATAGQGGGTEKEPTHDKRKRTSRKAPQAGADGAS